MTPKTWGNLSERGGFTLVEVLAAVVLLSVGLLAIISAIQASRMTQDRSIYLSVGRSLAQSRIEQMRAMPFDLLDTVAGVTSDPSLPVGNHVTVQTTPYPNALETDIRRVTVAVTWKEGRGTRAVRYETLIVRR